MGFNLSYMFSEKERLKEYYTDLFSWVADGSLKVAKVTEFPMKDVAAAHRALESGSTVGKLVLLTEGDLAPKPEADQTKSTADDKANDETQLLC